MEFVPRNVLVTGGAGFVGSHVVRKLLDEFPDCRVVVVDKLDQCASLMNVDPRIHRFVQHDIRDAPITMLDLLRAENIDTVMHFAAHTHVDNSFGNSLEFTLNNTYGTHVLLEACRVYGGIRRFINVSTDEVYGESMEKATENKTVLEPTNPYSAAKAGAELIARAYHQSFQIPVITTRGNNVYGPGQYPEKVVPRFLMRAAQGLPLEVHGDGSSVRSFVYVDDVADAFLIILRKGRVGDVYNVGSTWGEKSVLDIAWEIAKKYTTRPGIHIRHVRDRPFNDRRYFICDAKLTALGWAPKTSWEDGLRKTAEWYANVAPTYWTDMKTPLDAHPHCVQEYPLGDMLDST